MRSIFFLFSLIILALPSFSQSDITKGERSVWAVRNSEYPRVTSDHRALFKIKAPEAKSVQLDLGKKYDMKRNANGEWECITDSLGSGFHYYSIIIDGVSVTDPSSETFYGCSRMMSGIDIPYEDEDNRFTILDVPHGDVRMHRYFSKVSNGWRRIYVYTPPFYDSTEDKYPVLYLQHGGGEDERGWSNQGLTDIIMDNLISRGEAKPMIIVMTDGNTPDFTRSLMDECIPFIESSYRVIKEKYSRALAGLSMGGIQTLNTVIENPDYFSYVGVFSSGWFKNSPNRMFGDVEKYYEMLQSDPAKYNGCFKQFWISMGGKEDIAYMNCQVMMKRFDEIGLRYTYFETPGGHTWPVWRESLYHFAKLLFK